jgi:hypothetical protein
MDPDNPTMLDETELGGASVEKKDTTEAFTTQPQTSDTRTQVGDISRCYRDIYRI